MEVLDALVRFQRCFWCVEETVVYDQEASFPFLGLQEPEGFWFVWMDSEQEIIPRDSDCFWRADGFQPSMGRDGKFTSREWCKFGPNSVI